MAKYGSSFHKSPLFISQKQADNSVNTPMLPSLTSGCRGLVHPGVRGGNMGMSGNKSALPDNQNHPVLPIFIAVFREKGSVFSLVYFMRFPGFGAVALVVQICLRGFPAFFLSLPPIKQYQENYEDFRHECMLRLKN